MSEVRARQLFATARVARLATATADGVPHLVPIVFAVDPGTDTVYFAIDHKPKSGAPLRRLGNIAMNPNVCLLVDLYAEDWTRLWWARADGTARIATTATEADRGLDALAHRYEQYRAHPRPDPVIAVEVHRWSGWSGAG